MKLRNHSRLLILGALVHISAAHDHSSNSNPEGTLDGVVIAHIGLQFIIWSIIFPVGLIFGFTRARWHVPLQVFGYAMTLAGYILGHKHLGRTFAPSLHEKFAWIVLLPICLQFIIGVYLKLHIHEGTKHRAVAVFTHRIVGLSYPAFGWTQILFGALVLTNVCSLKKNEFKPMGVCIEPVVTGMTLLLYGFYTFLFSLTLSRWRGQSPDTWDSIALVISGILCLSLNFVRLGPILLGFTWAIGGIASFLLSRNGRRTILPGLVLIGTGFALVFESKPRSANSKVLISLGIFLASTGSARVLEVFILSKKPAATSESSVSFQQVLVPTGLMASGFAIISLNDEFMSALGLGDVDILPLLLLILGLSLCSSIFMLSLSYLFHSSGRNASKVQWKGPTPRKFAVEESDDEEEPLRDDAYELGAPLRSRDSDDE